MPDATRLPNVVLMNCDDLGYGDLGCYGSALNYTPTLDGLASEGMLFTDFYMASPVCSPSRAALLTGCYPPRIGFADFDGLPVLFPGQRIGLSSGETTIATLLSEAGYATQHVGKWHCGDQPPFLPTRHGFDGSFGIPYSNDMGRQRSADGGPNFMQLLNKAGVRVAEDYPPLPLLLNEEVLEAQPDQVSLTARFVSEGVRFMRANRSRPFFLYVAHIYVHLPIYVQQRFASASRNGNYGAAVASIDWAAAVLLAELRSLGLEDDTIVIFTSDNGSLAGGHGGSNAPLRGTKGQTWEGGMRVPCIVRWPGRVPARSVCTEIATAMDFLPTIAAAVDSPLPEQEIDGQDITGLLEGREPSPHDCFYYYTGTTLAAVRRGRWKLHLARNGQPVEELYDLSVDVSEHNDVATSFSEVVANLQTEADRARSELGDSRLGIVGGGVRQPGLVDHSVPLTEFNPDYPYYATEYDLTDRG